MSTTTSFNVGDKVRYVGTHSGHHEIPHPIYYYDQLLEKGDELVVDKIDRLRFGCDVLFFNVSPSYPKKDFCIQEDGSSYLVLYASDFELVSPAKTPSVSECVCDTFSVLMVKGCQCGYLSAQRSAKSEDLPF